MIETRKRSLRHPFHRLAGESLPLIRVGLLGTGHQTTDVKSINGQMKVLEELHSEI